MAADAANEAHVAENHTPTKKGLFGMTPKKGAEPDVDVKEMQFKMRSFEAQVCGAGEGWGRT